MFTVQTRVAIKKIESHLRGLIVQHALVSIVPEGRSVIFIRDSTERLVDFCQNYRLICAPATPAHGLMRGGRQIVGLPAAAGIFLGALARIACAIFTLTIRIAALGQFFTHRSTAYASRHACSNMKWAAVSTQEMDINDIPKHP